MNSIKTEIGNDTTGNTQKASDLTDLAFYLIKNIVDNKVKVLFVGKTTLYYFCDKEVLYSDKNNYFEKNYLVIKELSSDDITLSVKNR